MKVKELIKILKNVDPELEVILAQYGRYDEFYTIKCFEIGTYIENESSSSTCRIRSFTGYNKTFPENLWNVLEEGRPAICLWPIN